MTAARIRVLYVIENERYGGGERAFAQLIHGLDKSRFEIFVACLTCSSGSAPFVSAIAGAARVINLDLRRLVDPLNIFRLRGIITRNGINVVHSQGPRADFYARLAAAFPGAVRLVSTVASPVEEYDSGVLRRCVYKAMDGFLSCRVDKYIAVAEHIRRKLVDGRGMPQKKVARIYNGVDAGRYDCSPAATAQARGAYNIPAGRFLAAAFCRLSSEKGLFTLLEAVALDTGVGIQYLIAGAGPLEVELKAKAAALRILQRVIFAGFVPDPVRLICASDLILLPSLREGFPVALLEGMAAGKPIVASRIEGIDESVEDGVSGLLVTPGDAAGLAAAINKIAADTEAAAVMGQHGRTAVLERFSETEMIRVHAKLYAELCQI